MCDRVVPEDPFLIVCCPDKYIALRMCDEAVDDSPAALKLIPNGFATIKMIKKLYTALYANEYILYFIVNLNDINLDNNFDKNDPRTIFLYPVY